MTNKTNNRQLTYKVTPAVGLAPIWKSIKAWLVIYTQDGQQVTSGTPYASEEGAIKAGEIYISTWGEFGRLAK